MLGRRYAWLACRSHIQVHCSAHARFYASRGFEEIKPHDRDNIKQRAPPTTDQLQAEIDAAESEVARLRQEKAHRNSNVLSDDKLYPWQSRIVEMVKEPAHDRHVYWYYDEGNSGKSALAKLLVNRYDALMLADRQVDIKHRVHKYHETKGKYPCCVIFNLPRASANNLDYPGLEDVKDGNIASTKYDGGEHSFPPPHVIVFANKEPDTTMLTRDRWRVECLDEEVYGDEQLLQELKAKEEAEEVVRAKLGRKEREAITNERLRDKIKASHKRSQDIEKKLHELSQHGSQQTDVGGRSGTHEC